MKKIILLILLLSSVCFADATTTNDYSEFAIEFNSCVGVNSPLVFSSMRVKEIGPRLMKCNQSDKSYFCNMDNSESLYFDRKKDVNLTLEFGSGDKTETVFVRNRIATYTRLVKNKYYVDSYTCQGIITTKQDMLRSIKLDLNSGFKKIANKLIKEKNK